MFRHAPILANPTAQILSPECRGPGFRRAETPNEALEPPPGGNQSAFRTFFLSRLMIGAGEKRVKFMRGTFLLAVLLIVGGVAALAVPYFTYTQKERVVDVGPIQIDADKTKQVNIPQIAAIAALVAGVALLLVPKPSDA
jgi:uncharacterized membrane protein YidH (DUF202 family)